MGWRDLFKRKDEGRGVDALAERLKIGLTELRGVQPAYHRFSIPKRSGGSRTILAPDAPLKRTQRTILRRLFAHLPVHGNVTGFERGHSIVSNALPHVGRAVVVRMDVEDFFGTTTATRVGAYFRAIGWNDEASDLLVRLCTHEGSLPQGAPTSPRLSNLVNFRLDARLAGWAARTNAAYTRYADDLTFSFAEDDSRAVHKTIRLTKLVLADEGYRLHQRLKLHIRRRHDRQVVTGLVVDERVNLRRSTRRWLRAVEHHRATGRDATLTPEQLTGWHALRQMVSHQAS